MLSALVAPPAGAAHLTCQGNPTTIDGTPGNDTIAGTPGDDVIDANAGNDRVEGAGGNDLICGGEGNDRLASAGGVDRLDGGPGNDRLTAGADNDVLFGGPGDDRLFGEAGIDAFIGGPGDDQLRGGGGGFADQAQYFDSPNGVDVNLATGIAIGHGTDSLFDIQQLVGSNFDDTLIGNAGSNNFIAMLGDDLIDGGPGFDGIENNFLPDPVTVDLAAGTVSGQGNDQLLSIEAAGGTAGEDLLLGSEGPDSLTGRAGDDAIFGKGGNDDLAGNEGDDFLDGGDGTDTADGGPDSDTCVGSETTIDCESDVAPGRDVAVGAFQLDVQVERQFVSVKPIGGLGGVPSPIVQLNSEFLDFDPTSGTAMIAVSLENTREKTLFSPLAAVITNVASADVVPVNPSGGSGPGTWRWDYDERLGDGLLSAAEASLGRRWDFLSPDASDFQVEIAIHAGVPLAPGEGATIHGEGGLSVTVQPNSIPYETLIDVAPAPLSQLVAPLGQLELASWVHVTYEPAVFNASLVPPGRPLELSLPAPKGIPEGEEFLVGQQLLTDFVGEAQDPDSSNAGDLLEQLVAVDNALVMDGRIVTQPHLFSGILGPGVYAIVFAPFTGGTVTGAVQSFTPAGGFTRMPGSVVSNDTNPLVAVADGAGRFVLPVSSSPFTLTAFHPFAGATGSASSSIPSPGSTVTQDIQVTFLTRPPITRDGIRNGGFERDDLTSWASTGAGNIRQQLPCSGNIIAPTEGLSMADIDTGITASGGVGSSLTQALIVPAGAQRLRLSYNVVSEEFPDAVGDDVFRAQITVSGDPTPVTFAEVRVSTASLTDVGDCSFTAGDASAGETGWTTAGIDVAAFAGRRVLLSLNVVDEGQSTGDTHVLIDNIRFATVWVDAKIMALSGAAFARVQSDVELATEILSQAGLNVRIRNVTNIPDPGGLVDLDVTWVVACTVQVTVGFPELLEIRYGNCGGVRTAEEIQLMSLSRGPIHLDVNVYYIRSFGPPACGFAVGPDDFRAGDDTRIDLFTESGAILTCPGGNVLAHELGHLLVSPLAAGDVLEHAAPATNFLFGGGVPILGIVTRPQSANINRPGAPLLVP